MHFCRVTQSVLVEWLCWTYSAAGLPALLQGDAVGAGLLARDRGRRWWRAAAGLPAAGMVEAHNGET